jgi:folylpolyglutamate synthase
VFNCTSGRSAESLLKALLSAGGADPSTRGNSFDHVVFCTNVTYSDGGFKGGECIVFHNSFSPF